MAAFPRSTRQSLLLAFIGYFPCLSGMEIDLPSWELTYPIAAGTFESMIFPTSPGRICDTSLEGIRL